MMTGQRKTYDDILAQLREVTDPNQPAQSKLHLWTQGGTVLPQIAALREAAANLRTAISEHAGHQTPKAALEEMEDTLRKLDKNVQRVIADYGRYLDHVQDCRCVLCQAGNATNN